MRNLKLILLLLLTSNYFSCEKCEELTLEPCEEIGEKKVVDLVIIMDQSGSMQNEAVAISNAVEEGLQNALDTCPSDLRITYLGLAGNPWKDSTIFKISHLHYLDSILLGGISSGGIVLNSSLTAGGEFNEKGSSGVIDLSRHFDWRANTCRTIFYISDEELDSNTPANDFINEDQITQQAIDVANENEVTVFLHFVDSQPGGKPPQIKQNYEDLAEKTGGRLFYTTDSNVPSDLYVSILPEVVCNSCKACTLNTIIK